MPRRLRAEVRVSGGRSFQRNSLNQGQALYTKTQVFGVDVLRSRKTGTDNIVDRQL